MGEVMEQLKRNMGEFFLIKRSSSRGWSLQGRGGLQRSIVKSISNLPLERKKRVNTQCLISVKPFI